MDKRFNKWSRNCTGIFTSGNFSLERVVSDLIVEVTLDLFPKASFGKIAFVGFALGFKHFYVCGYTAKNCSRGRKELEPGFARNVVVHIEGRHKSQTVPNIFNFTLCAKTSLSIKLSKSDSALPPYFII